MGVGVQEGLSVASPTPLGGKKVAEAFGSSSGLRM